MTFKLEDAEMVEVYQETVANLSQDASKTLSLFDGTPESLKEVSTAYLVSFTYYTCLGEVIKKNQPLLNDPSLTKEERGEARKFLHQVCTLREQHVETLTALLEVTTN